MSSQELQRYGSWFDSQNLVMQTTTYPHQLSSNSALCIFDEDAVTKSLHCHWFYSKILLYKLLLHFFFNGTQHFVYAFMKCRCAWHNCQTSHSKNVILRNRYCSHRNRELSHVWGRHLYTMDTSLVHCNNICFWISFAHNILS